MVDQSTVYISDQDKKDMMQLCEVVLSSHMVAVGAGASISAFNEYNEEFHLRLKGYIKEKKKQELHHKYEMSFKYMKNM